MEALEHRVLPPWADGPGSKLAAAVGGVGLALLGAWAGAHLGVQGDGAPLGFLGGLGLALALWAGVWGRVRVGDDGVALPVWHGRRFVSWRDVATIETTDHGVALGVGGETFYLPTSVGVPGVSSTAARDALYEDLCARRAAWLRLPEVERLPMLDAADDATTPAEWLARLRAMGSGDAPSRYRTAAPPPDTLWRIVEHPGADAHTRVAAAVVLAAADEGAREGRVRVRLRAIARSAASPSVRVALENVIDGRDEGDDDRRFGNRPSDH